MVEQHLALTKAVAPKARPQTDLSQSIDKQTRMQMIAQAAYYRAERRGFAPGSEVDDWLAAEHDIDMMLNKH